MLKGLVALSALLLSSTVLAQAKEEKKWDVAAPPLKTRSVPINVTEGTWMNLDVSPDGRTIAFDLLGDIYTIPVTGGRATRIAAGMPFEIHPRFSPDGRSIAFTSDRGGGDNIWVMNTDGSNKRALTKETFTLLNNPTWSPDGRFIAARKHFTTYRSLGTGEIWLYHVTGGNGVPLVERPNPQFQKELGEPIFSATGDGIYFSRDTTPGNNFEYAQDSNKQVFAIERYDMKTGERTTVAGGPGGAVRPTPSPDGRWLVFVKRERAKSKLYIKDLRSGAERKIYDDLDQDLQETWAVKGVYPNMDWLPDSSAIIFWAGGKIHRIAPDGGAHAEIPFQVSDSREVIDPPQPKVAVFKESFTTRMPRFATVSPDGSRVVFETLGRLYVKDMAGGAPRALTPADSDFQVYPAWSRDGSRIAFVSWNDRRLGELRVVNADGSGMRTVSDVPGHYRRPQFSPDGATIVFERGGSQGLTSDTWSEQTGVFRVPSAGGQPATMLTRSGGNPHFGASGDRVYMETQEDGKLKLVSTDLSGQDKRTHAQGDLIVEYRVSPTGDRLAFRENYNVFAVPFFAGARTLDLGAKSSALPVTRASGNEGGQYIDWGSGGRQLGWSVGPTFYSADASSLVPTPGGATYKAPTSGTSLAIQASSDRPTGAVALVGARVVTMADSNGGIIDDGVVLIEGNRIRAVGRRGEVTIPAGAQQVDVAGKTIIPGIIDGHAHGPQGEDDLIPQQNWSAHSHLALGVTTIHDPSSTASEIFAAAEMQRAGLILAPRTYSSGEIVYGARSPGRYAVIDSVDDALGHIRRLKSQGAHSIKNYNQPRRDQRQQVVAAGLRENIAVVAEGGSLFDMDMTIIADGNTTLEHNIPLAKLYEDVESFFAGTKVGYNPTLVVTYGGPAGDPYWRQATEVWKHPLLSAHAPPQALAGSIRVVKAPEEDYVDKVNAAEALKLSRRGVPVAIGAHGQEEGLGSHWELWSYVRGGMTPIEALRAATVAPAQIYGFTEIGSLEGGKLADLVILDADPTQDIRNSDKIAKVMLNGRLYDAKTLNEEVTGTRQRQPYYWEDAAGTATAARP
jgi:imidazolonepropionase-like amidohydrolase/Tol biopolymer transport system component